jgi:cell division protein FtsW (lipid II flippase)/cell division protein FtsI/penicillin-binding protein 2
MRVIAVTNDRVQSRQGTLIASSAPTAARAANIELLGLSVCAIVIAFGLWLTTWGRVAELDADSRDVGPVTDLRGLRAPSELAPLLTMFESPLERQAVAVPLFRRAVAGSPALDHVGGLADVTLSASDVRADKRLVQLRTRLERRPTAARISILTSSDVAALKSRVVVRSRTDFAAAVRRAGLWFFAAFALAHFVRRWRGAHDDPLVLPVLLTLCGIGLMSMIALRDPLRDTLTALTFAQGVALGLVLLVAASEVDFEASPLRRAVIAPLGLALGLAALLLVMGTGPGTSGVKVNLFGVQPVEAIRLLVVFALAAYFARRLDVLRELSEAPTPSRPWLRVVRVPRWKDIRPIVVAMALVLAFFFLQKDLGPALVLSCVVMALYAIARGRVAFVFAGFGMLLVGFGAAYLIGHPSTVGQRVSIWLDPWDNGVPGGNQIAHGLWALATGSIWGSGPGLGSPQSIPAGHTDFVLAAVGEELGFVGVAVVVGLYAILSWRCLRIAARAPGDYTAFLAVGVALGLVVQAFVIGSGLLGLFPLAGVVTPFLSYGRSSMLANSFAVGVVLAVARRRGPIRRHLYRPIQTLAAVLMVVAAAVLGRAGWVQVVKADTFATASSLTEQADGGYRFEYNPRLISAARRIQRGSIYDRNGLVLATSKPQEIETVEGVYKKAGLARERTCTAAGARCYPLGGMFFSILGDWDRQTNWGARNASFLERDSDARLKGFDDQQRVVTVVNPRTGGHERTIKRDYSELLPLVRHGFDSSRDDVTTLLSRPRDLRSSIDARLQVRVASALRAGITRGGHTRGAAVVIDVESGDVLASVSYPWPAAAPDNAPAAAADSDAAAEALLDRARYGLYPPGSTFKLLVAGAALRTSPAVQNQTFACVRLPDGRVGNFVRGWSRPVRDDPMDRVPHGEVGLQHGLVVSCNAYFAQLALRLGPQPILDAASIFQIEAARPATAAQLRRTLPHAGYGQADVLVSPLKMARVAASIAGRGVVLPLQWTTDATAPSDEPQTRPTPPSQSRFLSESDAATLARYMREAVTSGTGRALAGNPTAIAGKTGTAEVDDGRAHSWFAGFAPFGGTRRIAFAVIVENAGYGARAAAPIAGDIVNAARDLGLVK